MVSKLLDNSLNIVIIIKYRIKFALEWASFSKIQSLLINVKQ